MTDTHKKSKLTKEKIQFLDAALQGDLAVIRQLLNKGIEPDTKDDRSIQLDMTPLMHAAGQGHIDVVQILVASGASVNAQARFESERGCTPLHYAAHGKYTDIMEFLLKSGADVNAVGFGQYGTPLHTLLLFNHQTDFILGEEKEEKIFKGMTILLNAGADPNIPNKAENSCPLQAAVKEEMFHVVRLLIDKGANVNHRDHNDQTAFVAALYRSRKDIALFLLEHGLDIHQKSKNGSTALMIAVSHANATVVDALIQAGADVNAVTNEGFTVLDLAVESQCQEIIDMLNRAGAKRGKVHSIRGVPTVTKMRGVGTFDYDGKSIWILADPEAVTDALSYVRKAKVVRKDLRNKSVKLTDQFFLIFRLEGHTWTQIIAGDRLILGLLMNMDKLKLTKKERDRRFNEARKLELNKQDAKLLSEQLSTRALFYGISDTAGALMYEFYENGELIEQLETTEGYKVNRWKSTLHPIRKKEMEHTDVLKWINELFIELDIFDPGLSFDYMSDQIGKKVTIGDLVDDSETFERVDFVGL